MPPLSAWNAVNTSTKIHPLHFELRPGLKINPDPDDKQDLISSSLCHTQAKHPKTAFLSYTGKIYSADPASEGIPTAQHGSNPLRCWKYLVKYITLKDFVKLRLSHSLYEGYIWNKVLERMKIGLVQTVWGDWIQLSDPADVNSAVDAAELFPLYFLKFKKGQK